MPGRRHQAMATDLTDLVEQLKRELAVPGAFATTYPSTTNDDLVASLEDGVGEAQLLGFLPTSVLDTAVHSVDPDLSPAARTLVVLFAADRIMSMRLLDLTQRSKYQAGPVLYETEKSANMLTEVLKQMRARRDAILRMATGVGGSSGGFAMTDMYGERICFYEHEVYC